MGLMVKELVKASVMSVKKELRWCLRQHRKSTTHNYSSCNHRNAIAAQHHHPHLVEVLAGHGQQDGSVTSHTTQDGTVKMKILIKKQDLDRILLEAMNNNTSDDMLPEAVAEAESISSSSFSSSSSSSSSSMESPLYDLLRIMRRRRARDNPSNSTWRPALHTIPE